MAEDPSERIESLEQQVKQFSIGFMIALIAAIALGLFAIGQNVKIDHLRAELQSANGLLQSEGPAANARAFKAQAEREGAEREQAGRELAGRAKKDAEFKKQGP